MDSWEIHYYGVLQSFRLGGFGFTNALNYFPLSSFSLCLDHTFLKGELAKDEAPFLSSSLFFCCMCATVVYPQTPPGLLHVRRATRMRFFVLHLRVEERKNRGKGYFFQINQDRDTKGTSFSWECIITLLLLASILCVLTFCSQSVWESNFLCGCVYGASVHRQFTKEDFCDRVRNRSIMIGQQWLLQSQHFGV